MSANNIASSYAKSLAYCALFNGLGLSTAFLVEMVFVDFIYENPNRTQENAFMMMTLFTPIFFFVAFLGTLLVFGPSQILKLKVVKALTVRFGDQYELSVIALLPLTAISTWYAYDYLTPTGCDLAINAGPNWTPYRHGLTAPRYLKTLAFQTPITILTYLHTKHRSSTGNRVLVLASFAIISILAGAGYGYDKAKNQHESMESRSI